MACSRDTTIDTGVSLLDLESANSPGSPVRQEEEEILMDTSTDWGTFVSCTDSGARPKTGPSVSESASTHQMTTRSTMAVSTYDGRELFIAEELLAPFEGSARRIEREVVDGISCCLSQAEFATVPEIWLRTYPALARGLVHHEGLRKALWDCEMSMADGIFSVVGPRMPADDSDGAGLECVGFTGLDRSRPLYYRTNVIRPGPALVTREDYEQEAMKNARPVVWQIEEGDIQYQLANHSRIIPDRASAIRFLVDEAITLEDRRQKLSAIQDQAEADRALQKREESDKEAKRKAARKVTKNDRKSKKDKSGSKTHSEGSVVSDTDEFVEVKTRKSKKDKKRAAENVPDSQVADQIDASATVSTDTKDPEEEVDPSPTKLVDISMETAGDESDHDSSREEEVSGDKTEQDMWNNSRAGFPHYIPVCLEDCKTTSTKYKTPPAINRNGESDDEDWLRESRKEKLPSHFNLVWLGKAQRWPETYYTRDQKHKLKWAADVYFKEGIRDKECPFALCENGSETPRVYRTRTRFIRHLVEIHMHHHPEYICDDSRGKICMNCNGLSTPRRGVMVRHLTQDHGYGFQVSVEKVRLLHKKLMDQLAAVPTKALDKITSSNHFWCEVMPTTKQEKLCARLELPDETGRLDMTAHIWDQVCLWKQGRFQDSRRVDSRRHYSGERFNPERFNPEAPHSRGAGYRSRSPSPMGRGRRPDLSYPDRSMPPPGGRGRYQSDSSAWWQHRNTREQEFPEMPSHGSEAQVLDQYGRAQGHPDYQKPPHAGRKPEAAGSAAYAAVTATTPPSAAPGMLPSAPKPLGDPVKLVPVRQEPVPLPKGALVHTPRPARVFFTDTQVASSDIQKTAFKVWQDKQMSLGKEFLDKLSQLSLECVHGIHQAEVVRLQKEEGDRLKKEMAEASAAKSAAASSTEYLREQIRSLQERNEELNVKFLGAFGVLMDGWDGTPEHAFRLLQKKWQSPK